MRAKPMYKKIWVKAAPSRDDALIGKEIVRMPWQRDRFFTSEPVEVECHPGIIRMLRLGDLVEVPAPRIPAKKDKE